MMGRGLCVLQCQRLTTSVNMETLLLIAELV